MTQSYPGMKLDALLQRLSPADREALTDALGQPEVFSSAFLTRLLRKEGHHIGVTTVKEWRAHRTGGVVR